MSLTGCNGYPYKELLSTFLSLFFVFSSSGEESVFLPRPMFSLISAHHRERRLLVRSPSETAIRLPVFSP